jgi:hypothetical protein
MIAFDRILVAPTPDQREATLVTAVEVVNSGAGVPQLAWPLPELDTVFDRVEHEPAGEHYWDGPRVAGSGLAVRAVVQVIWWADFLGQRHIRVQVETREGPFIPTWRSGWDAGPPLLQIYPEAGFAVSGDDIANDVLVLCACGAAGTPAEIAWMGSECGPCHDRRAAGVLPDRPWEATRRELDFHGFAPVTLRFSPDGSRLLIIAMNRYEWDIETGLVWPYEHPAGEVVAWSPDGAVIVVSKVGSRQLQVLRTDSEQIEGTLDVDARLVEQVFFSPTGQFLLALGYQQGEAEGEVYTRRETGWERVFATGAITSWAFGPGDEILYVGTSEDGIRFRRLSDPDSPWQELPLPGVADPADVPAYGLHLTPDGRGLIVNAEGHLRVIDLASGNLLRERETTAFYNSNAARFQDAESRVLVGNGARHGSLGLLTLPDLTHLHMLRIINGATTEHMACNGHWLAVASDRHARLVPWPPLLGWYLGTRGTTP